MKKEKKTGLPRSSQGQNPDTINRLEKILTNLPQSPGVYQMKDKGGKVIYVGKAKNLKSRVTSYFRYPEQPPRLVPQHPSRGESESLSIPSVGNNGLTLAKRQMVGKIADIETILCQTEIEALVLETNLIKHLRPKYNILMKDDKNLAYIKITHSPVPELVKTRVKIKDGGEYYGPYVSSVEQCVRALRRMFRIRNCRMKFENTPLLKEVPRYEAGDSRARRSLEPTRPDYVSENNPQSRHSSSPAPFGKEIIITDKAGKTIPCMDYYIGLCPAPCLLEEAKVREHMSHIDELRRFLRGESQAVFVSLEARMKEQAQNLEFEEAQKTKQILEGLRSLHERQKVRDMIGGDHDIIVQYEKYNRHFIGLTSVRAGQIVGVFRHELTSTLDVTVEEMLSEFLALHYISPDSTDRDFPESLILTHPLDDEVLLDFFVREKISIEIPQAGPKQELITFTLNQLREYAYKSELQTLENKTLSRDDMVHILERLGYGVPKKGEIVFECYDISHTHGQFTVASKAVIVNGKPDPSRYRKYNIKSLPYDGKIDDFASHQEVMKRRTVEGLESGIFPHLIIIDGGKGQLSSALLGIKEGEWMKNEEGRMKNEEYKTKDVEDVSSNFPIFQSSNLPICSIAKREEEVFIPGEKKPIIFEKGTPELMLLQKARDESHRFAITANRQARTKAMKKNILEELPGFGPVTRRKLLKLAGSVDGIRNLTLDELDSVCTKSQVETLRDHGIL